MNRINKLLKEPYYTVGNYLFKHYPKVMSDKWYLKVMWKRCMGYKLDLAHPVTFNEKLQWLKLYDQKPIYTTLVDKYRAKRWIADRIGEQYVVPTLAVYDSVDEIDLDQLPEKFVLKCNHDSGNVIICEDKSAFDLETAKKELAAALKKNYYWVARERPYKNVKRVVLAEKLLEASNVDDIVDYKLMCFDGKVKCSFTCTNRRNEGGLKVTFFDLNWERMPFERKYPAETQPVEKPASYAQMVDIAERLSEDIAFSRVDFYEVEGVPYIGEITLYPGGGFEPFRPQEWDKTIGGWIKLPID